MELTPQEKQKIYEEEKIRIEARERIEKEKEAKEKEIEAKKKRKNETVASIISLIIFIVFIVIFGAYYLDNGGGKGTSSQIQIQQEKITPEKLQNAVKSMAEFMVRDDNKIGLKMWARKLGRPAHNFESAETLYANIRQASNDFEAYRNPENVLNLLRVLGNTDIIFDEVLLESLRAKTK